MLPDQIVASLLEAGVTANDLLALLGMVFSFGMLLAAFLGIWWGRRNSPVSGEISELIKSTAALNGALRLHTENAHIVWSLERNRHRRYMAKFTKLLLLLKGVGAVDDQTYRMIEESEFGKDEEADEAELEASMRRRLVHPENG